MKKHMKKIIAVLMVLSLVGAVGCSDIDFDNDISESTENAESKLKSGASLSDDEVYAITRVESNAVGKEQMFTEKSQANFNANQPPTMLNWSLERENLDNRNQRWNNPNKISYIYLFEYGRLVGYYPMKGKVSSVNSKLTSNEQVIIADSYHYQGGSYAQGTVESPSMDGSYGSNGDAIFFFLTDGTYMEWNGHYLLFDKPMKVNVEPMITYEVKDKKDEK